MMRCIFLSFFLISISLGAPSIGRSQEDFKRIDQAFQAARYAHHYCPYLDVVPSSLEDAVPALSPLDFHLQDTEQNEAFYGPVYTGEADFPNAAEVAFSCGVIHTHFGVEGLTFQGVVSHLVDRFGEFARARVESDWFHCFEWADRNTLELEFYAGNVAKMCKIKSRAYLQDWIAEGQPDPGLYW